MYFGRLYFFVFAAGIGLLSFYEYSIFTKNKGIKVNLPLGLFSVFMFCLNAYLNIFDNFSFLMGLIVLMVLAELFRNNGSAILNLGGTFLGILYMGLFSASLIGIREFYSIADEGLYARGGSIIVTILACIWVCDSAAYYAGSAFGKHKLFPRVSPKKSWEGSLAGFIFSVITAIIARYIALDFLSWTSVIIIGVIAGTIGQLGDLIESLMKRDAEVKDSSNLIPGHGGVFDRFDSLLLTSPVIYIYLLYLGR